MQHPSAFLIFHGSNARIPYKFPLRREKLTFYSDHSVKQRREAAHQNFQVILLSKHPKWEAKEARVSRMQHYPSLWVWRQRIWKHLESPAITKGTKKAISCYLHSVRMGDFKVRVMNGDRVNYKRKRKWPKLAKSHYLNKDRMRQTLRMRAASKKVRGKWKK